MSGSIQQSGPIAIGRVAVFQQNGIVQDGGPADAGVIEQIGITNPGSLALAINSGTITESYTQLGFIVGTNGATTLSVDSFNGNPAATFSLEINGVNYPFPGPGNGDVIGPSTGVDGDLVAFNGATGTVIKDSGLPLSGVMVSVSTIALLRAATADTLPTTICYVTSYYGAVGDGADGQFHVNPSDTTSADNGGTIIVDGSARRWYRMTQGQPYQVKWFGAYGDGVHDDTAAINATIAAVAAKGNALSLGGIVRLPGMANYMVAGTIEIASSGIVLEGDGNVSSKITFNNGALDCIVVEGALSDRIQGCAIRNLYLQHTGKTGGRTIYAPYCDNAAVENLIIIDSWTGIDLWSNNTFIIRSVWCENLAGGAGAYGIRWRAASDGSDRSDYLVVEDYAMDGHYSGADGLVLDGLVATLMVTRSNLLRLRYGVLVENTGGSPSFYPNFMHFTDLSTEGFQAGAIQLNSGQFYKFTSCDLSNNIGAAGQGGADVNTVQILLDPEVFTRSVQFMGCWIAGSSQSSLVSAAFGVRLIGNEFEQFPGQPPNTYPAVRVADGASDHIIVANSAFLFGGENAWKYGLQVDAGAYRLVEDDNNWSTVGAGTINWLTSDLQSYAGTDVQNLFAAGVNAWTGYWQGLDIETTPVILTPENLLNFQLGIEGAIGTPFILATPTAAQLLAYLPSPNQGKMFPLLITNGTGVTATLQAGAGVVFNGITTGPATFAIASATTRLFMIRFNNASATSPSVEIRG